ncbi:MAG TPA: amidohydrolase family protein [Opitutaceae bacterium]
MYRRTFLTAAGASAAAIPSLSSLANAAIPPASGLIDTNLSLGDWVIRRSGIPNAGQLLAKLSQHRVTSAWVGNIDGVLHTDIAGVNYRLAATCASEGAGKLVPFGSINLTFPDWEDDLRRCAEEHKMPGIRLHPNYHGYTLEDPRFVRLLELAARRRLLVQIAVQLEDNRSQNPVLTAAPVQVAPLVEALAKVPTARVMLLNAGSPIFGGAPLLQKLTKAGVLFEVATLEGVAGIEGLYHRVPEVRVCFGSHVPYFYFEAALLKLQESALTQDQLNAVQSGNARFALIHA